MKWMIASDIHGSFFNCNKMLEAYEKEGAERLLLLGDLLYHGPRNDLPEDYRPKAVIKALNDRKNDLICVRGNCEAEVDQMVLEFPVLADYCLIPLGKATIFATHGHHHNPQTPPPLKAGDILLNGHTHVPKYQKYADFTYVNPGSVSIPKDGSWNGYMTLEDGLFLWKDFEGSIRMEWAAK